MRRFVSAAVLLWLTAGSAAAQLEERPRPSPDEERPAGALVPAGVEPGSGRLLNQGVYAFAQVQLNFRVGELTEDLGGGFDFEVANVAGVPDAILGIRYERLVVGLGFNWTQISTPRTNFDPCTGMPAETDDSAALFGVLPTVRYDVFTTDRDRGRLSVGATPVFLFSDRKTERFTGMCPNGPGAPGERDTVGGTDAVLGFDVHVGGRYHLFDPLVLGLEIGMTHLWFVPDNGPMETTPTTETNLFYFGITLGFELPL